MLKPTDEDIPAALQNPFLNKTMFLHTGSNYTMA